jgi:uncharacterized membrane protein SirB2
MSPTFYQILHIVSLFALVSSLTAVYFADRPSKVGNILLGISSLLVLIAGVGLVHKMGYALTEHWIEGKLGIWAIITVGAPIVAKRFPKYKTMVFFGMFTLLLVAVSLAFVKP